MTHSSTGLLDRVFQLKKHNTNIKTEAIAGLTTFMTMAYVLIVNPSILGDAGMPSAAVFTATALAAVIGSVLMALMANYPFALASGMGLNAFFAYSVVLRMGHTWQFALTAVLLEGFVFVLMSLFKVREAIFNSIPKNLKKAVSVGIGLFIALIGCINSGLIVSGKVAMVNGEPTLNTSGTLVQLGSFADRNVWLAILGLIIMGVLYHFRVKGALLFGILATTIIGIPLGVTHLPEGSLVTLPPSVAPIAFQFEWSKVLSFDMLIVLFSFLFVDIFDTLGTLVGVASKTNMLDEKGRLPRIKGALMADAVGTIAGSCLGTSTVTTYVESSAGVAEGGRTGLTSIFTAIFFALALFFAPVFGMVPSAATAPALIMVGVFMMSPIKDIDLSDMTEAIPAFLTIIVMPFAYSIAEGIVFGMISYVLLKLFTGRAKQVSVTMYILATLFILRYVLEALAIL